MANIRTYDIKFTYLSEYSSPISVYSSSLLQPLSINVGYWFATGSGNVTVLTSYDNQTYNPVYTTTATNNSVIYLSFPSFIGAFIKIQRSLTTLTLSGASVNNATVTSSTESNAVIFSYPQSTVPNDEIYALPTLESPVQLGVTQQTCVNEIKCFLTSTAWSTQSQPLAIVRKTPVASGLLVCSFIQQSVVSIDINYNTNT